MNIQQPTTGARPQFETEKTNGSQQERVRASEHTMSDQAARIGEALDQMKKASASIYDAVACFGLASGDIAKVKFGEGKRKAWELEEKAEHKMAEKPLLYVGAAFALGWLLSRVTR
jgi:hypothetical protein